MVAESHSPKCDVDKDKRKKSEESNERGLSFHEIENQSNQTFWKYGFLIDYKTYLKMNSGRIKKDECFYDKLKNFYYLNSKLGHIK